MRLAILREYILKILIAGFLVLLFTELSIAKEFSFRKTTWGMSIEEVKSSEPLKIAQEDENLLGYKTSVIGKNVFVAYFFIENQLIRARYVLAESHTNKNDYIADYNDFKEILTKKYGKPKRDETLWKNNLYKDDYSSWGSAIGMGHLVYLSTWETSNTEINNLLTGDNFDISCVIEYRSKKLKEIEKKAQEKRALDAF